MEVKYSVEGRSLLITSEWPEQDQLLEEMLAGGHTDINQIVLERVEITNSVALNLTNLLKSREQILSLAFVDCPRGVAQGMAAFEKLIDCFWNVRRLVLRTGIRNTGSTSRYFLPVQGASRVSSLRVCVRNLDERLTRELAAHITQSETLVDLSLSGSRRCRDHSSFLAVALHANKSIERLDLGDFQRDPARMQQLVIALKGHTKLRELDLSNNDISENTLRALGELISQEHCRLKALDLSMQRHPLKISLLAPALSSATTGLKQLHLSNCWLTEEEAIPFLNALTQNQHLESLDMSRNRQLSDGFLLHLAEVLPDLQIKTLNILKLKPPNGSPAAMRALQEGLSQNTRLQLLRLLFWREVGQSRWIQVYVNLNRGGRRALEENISLSLWPRVIERAQRQIYFCPLLKQKSAKEDAIFHLIRNAPGLW
eukprot:CAMPEP_0176141270 /NCGR_PEP_ID=MMETSP0120_2-20121206/71832_1 /TAXON_ID=160619 /ORGANISM="Kryptoperidinium foliaceum, Strain CCMP 1326" /LENGTH=427 /DNA_ID=CAMNT_0017477397 /DNA_START=198 /DNA_END=1478 /DNA_ORIENTATION=+